MKVQSVSVQPSTQGRQTPAVLTAHFLAGGVPAAMYVNFESPVSEWHFTVFGTRGVGIVDLFRDVLVTLPNDGQHLPFDVLRTSWAAAVTHVRGVLRSGFAFLRRRLFYGNDEVMRRFLDAISTGKPPEGISGEDGLAVVRLQHAMLNTAQVVG